MTKDIKNDPVTLKADKIISLKKTDPEASNKARDDMANELRDKGAFVLYKMNPKRYPLTPEQQKKWDKDHKKSKK
jgi:hypothetical protein